MRKNIVAMLFLLLNYSVYSQNTTLSKSRKSGYYTYVYQLSNKEILEYKKAQQKRDSQKLKQLFKLYHLVDSFATDSVKVPKLPFGNYLFARANEAYFESKIYNVHEFYAKLLQGDEHLIYGVYDINGKSIPTAKLTIKGKELKYNKNAEQYIAKKVKHGGELRIELTEQIKVLDISNSNSVYRNGIWFKITRSFPLKYITRLYFKLIYRHSHLNYETKSTGYFVLNKPQYLPGDTLKFKAYVLGKNFRPCKKDLNLEISSYTFSYQSKKRRFKKNDSDYLENNEIFQSKIVTPKRPGVFIGEVILSDSLKLDEVYQISLKQKHRKKAIIPVQSFIYKDYLLDEIKYETKLEKEEISGNEAQVISMKVTDFNGFLLPDIHYNMVVSLNYLNNFFNDSVFVKDTLLEVNGILKDNNETKIILSDTLFKNISGSYKVDVTYTNSNFEKHSTTNEFNINKKKYSLKLEHKDNLLMASCIDCSTHFLNDIKLYGNTTNNDTILKKEITLPYFFKPNPLIEVYKLYDKNTNLIITEAREESKLNISTWRKNDSLFFDVENPQQIAAVFKLYKGKELIQTKNDSTYSLKLYDKSNSAYYIVAEYLWQGEAKYKTASNQIYEKDLNIEINQPPQIYPGQKLKINLDVKDYKNEPVKNVELSAWSVNSQFENINLPNIPDFNSYKVSPYVSNFSEERGYHNSYYINSGDYGESFKLDTNWIKQLCLNNIPYYASKFIKNTPLLYYDTLNIRLAEFAVFLFDNGNEIPVQMLYIDGRLKFYNEASNFLPYAFTATPGFHNINIRTKDKIIEIDSVEFKAGNKLELVVNPNYSCKAFNVKNAVPTLTTDEIKLLRKSIFVLDKNFNYPLFVWQNENEIHWLNSYRQWNQIIGPFEDFKFLHVFSEGKLRKDFPFESGYDYKLNKFNVIMKENKRFTAKRINFPYLNSGRKFGEHVIYSDDFLFAKVATESVQLEITNDFTFTEVKKGKLIMDVKSDSTIWLVMLENTTTNVRKFYRGSYKYFSNLSPGFYKLYYLTKYFFGGAINITILPFTTSCYKINISNYKFQALAKNEYDLQLNVQEKKKQDIIKASELRFETDKKRALIEMKNKFGYGMIKVTIIEEATNETIPFATVTLNNSEVQIQGTVANIDGEAFFSDISINSLYQIKVSYTGYQGVIVSDVFVQKNKTTYLSVYLKAGKELEVFEIVEYSIPLVDYSWSDVKTVTKMEYAKMASKNINSLLAQSAGVAQFENGNGLYIRGGRSESSETFIDGMRVVGSSGLPQSSIEIITSGVPASFGDKNKSSNMDKEEEINGKDIASKGIRNNFADYAFWQPDMVSDVNGKASLEVTFPDNITQWKTFVVGMNNKKYSGSTSATVKAYKKVMAQLETPRFLIENDEANVVGKMLNVTNTTYPLKTKFSINNNVLLQTDTTLIKSIVQYQNIIGIGDTLNVQYECNLENGYSDGELQKIPVFKRGLNEKSGVFISLKPDTIYQLQLTQNLKNHTLSIYNNPIDFVFKDLEALQNYYYSCNEQIASKLKAFLLEEKIKKQTGDKFKKKKEINQLIKKLEKNQHKDGFWGWWNQSEFAVNWITLHVISALNMAKLEGYNSRALEKAERYLRQSKNELAKIDLLETYNLLSDMKVNIEQDEWLSSINKDSMALKKYDKLYIYLILQKGLQASNKKANIDSILKLKKTTYTGDIYWESDTIKNWRYNANMLTIMAYQILKNDSVSETILASIRSYLLQKRSYDGGWNNTYITANVLATILPDITKSKNLLKLNNVTLTEDGKQQVITSFPYVKKIVANNIAIEKQGIYPVFVNLYEENWNNNPSSKLIDFKIDSYFKNKISKVSEIKRGESITLVTEIHVLKMADYIKVEIPIPAGCVYSDASALRNYNESHREQFKNKTVVFFNQLNPGKYEISINLDARYSGKYSLNPAQIELMYLPLINGNNQIKLVQINKEQN